MKAKQTKLVNYLLKDEKNNIVKVKHATDEELSKYPPKGPGDKRIMDEDVKTDSKIIVTMDKLFRKRVNKEEMRKIWNTGNGSKGVHTLNEEK